MQAMTMSRNWFLLCLVGLGVPWHAAAAPSDSAPTSSADAARRALAVVSYNGGEVTVGEVEDALRRPVTLPNGKTLGEPPGSPQEALYRTLETELLEQEAQRRGYDKQFRVRYVFLDTGIQLLLDKEVDQPLRGFVPTEDELKRYFAEHKTEIDAPELRRVTQIVVATEAEARALLPQVQAADGAALRDLVNKHSIDAVSRQDSGYSRYFDDQAVLDDRQGSVDKGLAKAAFALPGIGATSDVVALADATDAGKGKGKFAIIRLAALRPAYLPTLEQARAVLTKKVTEERRTNATNAVAEEARKRLAPVYHYEVLDSLPAQQ
jgi:hypothetical protein